MKNEMNYYNISLFPALFSLTFAFLITLSPQTAAAQNAFPASDKQAAARFESRTKEYAQLRGRLEGKLPKLPKKATPEQIEAYKAALQRTVQTARAGARQGQIFTPDAARLIRAIIKAEFKGRDRRELREMVFEAETKGVRVKVNAPYPEAKELVEMPPTLLLALPQLPKQIRYRFVGRNLLLVDRENGLILDYMMHAVP